MMLVNRVTIREYDSLTTGRVWDPSARKISERQADAIENYQTRLGIKLFDIGRHSVKATHWVGSLGIGKYCIDVVPKIDVPDQEDRNASAMENLLHMVSAGGLVPFRPADIAILANSGKPLLEAFLTLYVKHLAFEWLRGPIRKYVSVEENRSCLRGKLLFQRHVEQNFCHKERFFTSSDEFITDNLISRLLKAALKICIKQSLSLQTSVKAKELVALFEDVAEWTPSEKEARSIQVDRTIFRYQYLLNLAKMILSQVSPSYSDSGEPVYSLMFDMNVVFQNFIAAELKRAMKGHYIVREQVSSGHLLRRQDGERFFRLRPDIGVYHNNKVLCLLDTKWKLLDQNLQCKNVSPADMYQMYAYGHEYDVPTTVLLYPGFRGSTEHVEYKEEYQHCRGAASDEASAKRSIGVCTVNLKRDLGNQKERQALRKELADLVQSSFTEHFPEYRT